MFLKELWINRKQIAKGNITKELFIRYYFSVIIFLGLVYATAQLLFPNPPGYSMIRNFISAQGDRAYNPNGAWVFIFGVGIIGILLIPVANFYYKTLKSNILYGRLILQLTYLTFLIGAIGYSMVGFFPRGGIVDPVHDVASTMAFGGLGFTAFISFFLFIYWRIRKAKWPSWGQFLLMYIPLFGILSLLILNISPSMNQWTSFFAVLSWLTMLAITLPEPATQSTLAEPVEETK